MNPVAILTHAWCGIVVASAIVATGAPTVCSGQETGAEVIRGRVADDSGHAVVGATVIITRGPDRLIQRDSTDATGTFNVRFDPGTGDYLVYVAAAGFASARRRVQREAAERELTANFTLARAVSTLSAVRILAHKPVRATNQVSVGRADVGAAEQWHDGVSGAIAPLEGGDLDALAGTMSNVTVTPTGLSILGGSATSNLITLNGTGLPISALPRAARVSTRVTATTFDPTRGGFSGANIDVQLRPADRFYEHRGAYLTLAPSFLQRTDAIGRGAGAQVGTARASLEADGEAIRNALTYSVALDVTHSASNPETLLTADDEILQRAGVAPDSVARLRSVAPTLGIPLAERTAPASPVHDVVSWLGRLDDTRDSLRTRALTSYATFTRDQAVGVTPLSAPSTGAANTQRAGGAQLLLSHYVGTGRRVLMETRLAASTISARSTPYESLPSANILVVSPTPASDADPVGVVLGGGLSTTSDARWTLEGSNQAVWNTQGRENHFKTLLWGRLDGLRQHSIANAFGTYSYASLGDFATGTPASFSRTLTEPARSGTVWNAAAALAHEWSPSRFVSVLYGARIDADGFGAAPARNVTLEQALGVRTDAAPMRIHVSPRLGFSYIYNRARDNGNGSAQSPVGQFYRPSVGAIRGGIGEFRDLLRPDLLADARAATGLSTGTSQVSCVGAAVPAPDWSAFATNPATIPTTCTDGAGLLADYAPPVSLISPSYDVPHSWRASVDWSSDVGAWTVRVGALASYDLSQPSTIDVNFAGTPRFTLAEPGNRPVFVLPAAIDPASGAVSAVDSRQDGAFGRVLMRTSDLRGYGAQLTATISPDVLRFRTKSSLYTSLSYTLQTSRRQYRGFDGAAFGDPRAKEWAPSNLDARHIIVLSGGFNTAAAGTLTLFARFQSGLPFTPLVQGDVNGDGISGDRAFIPKPSAETDSTLATQLASLLHNGSSTARACVTQYVGEAVPRNGCRGPWSAMLNLQWKPPTPKRWAGRVTPTIYVTNALGGLDQLLHGESRLRGWGTQPVVDPVLLVPRGFDPAAQRFLYSVNPKFAETRGYATLTRNPFRITLDISFDLTTDYDLQELRRAVEPVRTHSTWVPRSADSLTAFYLGQTSDVYKLLLANSDSVFLTRSEVIALRSADSVYTARVRAVYTPLGVYLAGLHGRDPGPAALDSARHADAAYWRIFWEQPDIVARLITPLQRDLLPMVSGLLAVPPKDREQSRWNIGYPVTPPEHLSPPVTGSPPRP